MPHVISSFILNSPDPSVYSITDGIPRPDRNIPLDVVIQMVDSSPFWSERGRAIDAYAQLEQSLYQLFASCGEMKRDTAAIIFFKITNSLARNSIIEKFLHKTYGTQYNIFWNSYLKQLRSI